MAEKSPKQFTAAQRFWVPSNACVVGNRVWPGRSPFYVKWAQGYVDFLQGKGLRGRSGHDIKAFSAELGKHAGIEEWQGREWIWQYVFPGKSLSVDPRSGKVRRRHMHESLVQKVVKGAALRAGVRKKVSCHNMRHSGVCPIMGGPLTEQAWALGKEPGRYLKHPECGLLSSL